MSAWRGLVVAGVLAMRAPSALADGGVPIASVRSSESTWTLLVRPAQPMVGPVEFDLIGPGVQEAEFELREEGGRPEVIAVAPGTDPRVAHVRTDLGTAGQCMVRVRIPKAPQPLEAELQVSPEMPGIARRLPWLLAWVPMSALLLVRAIATRGRSYTAPRP